MTETTPMEELVLLAKQGDEKAKERILQGFKPLLIKNARKYFGINQDFEDWLQEGRLVLLHSIESYDEKMGIPFPGYVQKQVFYYFVDERKKIREKVILDQPLKDGNGSLVDRLSDEDIDLERDFVHGEMKSVLYSALFHLSPKQREIIIEYYLNNKSLKDLARERELCYQSTVKLKAKALKNLRKEIKS